MDGETLILLGVGVIVVLFLGSNSSDGGSGDSFTVPDATGDSSFTSDIPSVSSDTSRLSQWADAIFHFEGGQPGNLNVRNNNPGNLKFAGQAGATLGDNGFAVFQSIDDGYAALTRQLQKYVSDFPNLTLTQLEAHYLGQTDYLNPKVTDQGNPFTYAGTIAQKLGVSPNDTLQSIFGSAA